ncbi:hypothetical protein [Streptomyces sp. HUAS ZL42]|uniref:hypothetical protein n=1 Tax=Streptomyces sp. HUAS ZL42 TaxID=3231715 RepID=UPI00345EBF86
MIIVPRGGVPVAHEIARRLAPDGPRLRELARETEDWTGPARTVTSSSWTTASSPAR